MFKTVILSLLSFWLHYTIGFNILPPDPATYWWDIPVAISLTVSCLLSINWLINKEIEDE